MSAASSVLMTRNFSKMFLRARRALEFLHDQDPQRTSADQSRRSARGRPSLYQSTRLTRYDAASWGLGVVMRLPVLIAPAMLLSLLSIHAANADDVAAFYRGRNLNFVVGIQCRWRRRPLHTVDRAPPRQTHLRAPDRHRPEYAGRRQYGGGQPHLQCLPAGRLGNRPVRRQYRRRSGDRRGGDQVRFSKVQLDRRPSSETSASKATTSKTFDDVLTRDMVTGAAGTGTLDFQSS